MMLIRENPELLLFKEQIMEVSFVYSQLSLRRTPSGPASAVRLREVSGL